jgi:hypothetical protein
MTHLSACLADALLTCERTLETHEPSCVPMAAMPFFIPVVHNLLGGDGTCGSTGALPSWRQNPEPLYTWKRRSPPRQGGEVQGHGTCGSAGAHLSRGTRSGAVGHKATSETTLAGW